MTLKRQRFRLRHLAAAALVLFVLWTGFLYAIGGSWRAWRRLGVAGLWTLRGTNKVEAFRVEPQQNRNSKNLNIGGHDIRRQGRDLAPDAINLFRTELLRASNEDLDFFGPHKGCEPEPGVAFRVWHGSRHTDVLVCYSCEQLWAVNPQRRPVVDFDMVRAPLVKLAKAAFPKDKEIQALTEQQ
ncbi:MAG TPA: hypothetical protein VF600_08555 [Abditibacteriaceae bacterium]|jgi:hypothetical protein